MSVNIANQNIYLQIYYHALIADHYKREGVSEGLVADKNQNCLQYKKQFKKWLWEKVREPKIKKLYNPIYLIENLGDEDSKLHKSIEGMKRGVSIAQDVAANYNKVAQWIGWPQVPKPFLKKEE